MQKIKFDFEATKERIYAPNSNVPIGAPVDRNGNIANDGNAYGIVLCKETENEKYWVKYNLVVMVAGYCDIIDAQEIWGDEYSAEAIVAMSDIIFCDDHKIGGGGGWPADLPKPSVGGYGYTEQGEQTVITWDGDTSGKEVVSSVPPFQLVKVAEAENHEKFKSANVSLNIMGSIIDGMVSNVEETEIESLYRALVPIEGDDVAVVFIAENSWDFGGENHSAGIYFINDDGNIFVTSLTYGTPDTVHKIDEKYLPMDAIREALGL